MKPDRFEISSLEELTDIAMHIAKLCQIEHFIAFRGEMGAGKTTLIQRIIEELNSNEVATSPTFSLVNEYQIDDNKTVYHFDCYRINSEEEMYDMGYEEYFYGGDLVLLEWPEKIPNLLPNRYIEVEILLNDKTRTFTIHTINKSV